MSETLTKLKEARSQAKLIRAELEVKALQRYQRLSESRDPWDYFDFHGPLNRLVDRFKDGSGELFYQFSLASDRQYGSNWPFWRTWQEHAHLRAQARLICGISSIGIGIMEGLTSFCVGEGFIYRVVADGDEYKPLVQTIESILHDWRDANDWSELEQELFKRSIRDGEYFLRHFPQADGMTLERTVEPEQIVEPTGFASSEWSYGIHNDPDDLQTIEGFWVALDGQSSSGEEVPNGEINHVKVNVDRIIKRGMTDFAYHTEELIRTASRAIENIGEATAIQSAIAFIRQHDTADADQVQEFVSGVTDLNRPNPFSRSSDWQEETFPPGKIIDIPKGLNYVPSPFASSVPNFTQAIESVLRAVVVRWNAPQWFAGGSLDTASFASSLTAENPFVKTMERKQTFYKSRWLKNHWTALEAYVRAKGGSITAGGASYTWEEIKRVIDIECEPPRVAVRNRAEESQVNQVNLQNKTVSPQIVAQEQGYDWEQVASDWEAFEERFGTPGGGLFDAMPDFGIRRGAEEPMSPGTEGDEQPEGEDPTLPGELGDEPEETDYV